MEGFGERRREGVEGWKGLKSVRDGVVGLRKVQTNLRGPMNILLRFIYTKDSSIFFTISWETKCFCCNTRF